MESGIFFLIDARHLPRPEYEYIRTMAIKALTGDRTYPPLFSGCAYSGEEEGTGGVTFTFWWEEGKVAQHEVFEAFRTSGMEDSTLCKICWDLARTADFVGAAYRCSPMRPKLNPSAPDGFEYLVVKVALDQPPALMGYPLHDW
ncbi:hypothetical protein [Halomonas sp. 328]|uniref:hypothetical protein n=1 Tax=Halomonas sp. 328 TaxID=2776704 RepID=UPI0018A7DDCA|nr:hypothetical protein [Halomonas sp. 328]MBF8224407.1 hypothetical protein [Halomonas sp. 328]